MALRLTVVTLCGLSFGAFAQEVPDLLGKWTYTVSGLEVHERCGQGVETGELVIERKITARAYRGKARTERSSEKCQGGNAMESSATIRVKNGNLVTVDYDEEGWSMDRLRYVDGELTADRGDGVSTPWVRAVEGNGDRGPTAEQLADLDKFLGEIQPDLSEELSGEYTSFLQERLTKTGLDEGESKQVAALTVDRMTACILDVIRESVLAQEIPVDKILAQQNVEVIFDPLSMDMKANQCVQDASWNAGVRIR